MFVTETSFANAGLYRNTLENIMFSPVEEKKKKEFHDETLSRIKKVSKLVEKFESGKLEITIDENNKAENAEDVCDGPVLVFPPTPKTRTRFDSSALQERSIQTIKETPIMHSAPRTTYARRLFDDKPQTDSVMTPPRLNFGLKSFIAKTKPATENAPQKPKIALAFKNAELNETPNLSSRKLFESKAIVETPILRTPTRQVSGISLIDAHIKTAHLNVTESLCSSRHKTFSSGSSSSESSGESSTSKAEDNNIFNVNNQGYYCKLARAQVHNKFSMYYKWNSEGKLVFEIDNTIKKSFSALRSIAATVSRMRLEVLNEIPKCNEDERMKHIKTIYENCKKGVNKEMDALCCSLFDLLDNLNEQSLSPHEEYVAAKYIKKCQNNL
uniref:Uncharacterized protein n=1 Tax=Caenorhabditis tropicalis TaxID=1561998 RepID=A0A1I7TN76_9PELO